MLFHNILLALPTLFCLAKAAVIPSTLPSYSLDPPVPELTKRCDGCNAAPGYGVGNDISSTVDIDVALRTFTKAHLDYTSSIATVFVPVKTDVAVTVKTVLSVGTNLYGWAYTDLVKLSAALDAYSSGSTIYSNEIFIKAGIKVSTFTKIHATYLKAFIHTCVASNVSLPVKVKSDLVLVVSRSIAVADCTVISLQTRIKTCAAALVSVVGSLNLDVNAATCNSAAVSLKHAMRDYIQSCIKKSTGLFALLIKIPLNLLLSIVNAWISGSVGGLTGSAATLLGINLKSSSDLSICQSIVKYCFRLSSSFNVVAGLRLDTSVCWNVFSSVSSY